MAASPHRRLDGALADDRQLTGRRTDHDIGTRQVIRNLGEQHGIGAKLAGQLARPTQRAIGNQNIRHAGLNEMPGDQFNGFAGADQQRVAIVEVGKNAPRHIHRRESHGDGVLADRRVRAHPLGNREHAGKHAPEFASHRARLGSDGVGRLELAKNLRLAKHHGIQTGGHLHHMF